MISPPNPWLKYNSDGASKDYPKLSSCERIFRDCRGASWVVFLVNLSTYTYIIVQM